MRLPAPRGLKKQKKRALLFIEKLFFFRYAVDGSISQKRVHHAVFYKINEIKIVLFLQYFYPPRSE